VKVGDFVVGSFVISDNTCHPEVGELDVTFDVFEIPGEPGLSVYTHSVEEGTPSTERFALLATREADDSREPRAIAPSPGRN
jgi:hypothetical protein